MKKLSRNQIDQIFFEGTKLSSQRALNNFHCGVFNFYKSGILRAETFRPNDQELKNTDIPIEFKSQSHVLRALNQIILERKSVQFIDEKKIALADLANLLIMALGSKQEIKWRKFPADHQSISKRALPSAGGIYAIDAYVIARNVQSLKAGVYRFSPLKMGLQVIRKSLPALETQKKWGLQTSFENAPCLILLTCDFKRVRNKYGPRGMRFVFMEAGGIGVAMNLIATASKTKFCYVGGANEQLLKNQLQIKSQKEGIVAIFAVGA